MLQKYPGVSSFLRYVVFLFLLTLLSELVVLSWAWWYGTEPLALVAARLVTPGKLALKVGFSFVFVLIFIPPYIRWRGRD
jgi:hypothetical protein